MCIGVRFDPRRTESAALATEHHFIRPGTAALFLASMLHVVFAESLDNPGTCPVSQLDALRAAMKPYSPERTAPVTGVSAGTVRERAAVVVAAGGFDSSPVR